MVSTGARDESGAEKIRVKGKRGLLITTQLPRLLREGEYHIEHTPDLNILNNDVRRINVFDSTGQQWPLSKKMLKKLRQDITDLYMPRNCIVGSEPQK